jgi:hypothetical protein
VLDITSPSFFKDLKRNLSHPFLDKPYKYEWRKNLDEIERRKVLEEIGKDYYSLSVLEFPHAENLIEKIKITKIQTLLSCMPVRKDTFSTPPQADHFIPHRDTSSFRGVRNISSVPSCERYHKNTTDSGSGGISD